MGFLFGLLTLQFDFIQRIWQTFLLETADKWSAIPLLLCCNTRLAYLRRLRFQFQSVLATPRAFDAEKYSISCTNIYFIPVSYSLTSESWSSGPAEAAHVGGGAHFTPYLVCTICTSKAFNRMFQRAIIHYSYWYQVVTLIWCWPSLDFFFREKGICSTLFFR